jgi:mono/diheme cytochrome c family protein
VTDGITTLANPYGNSEFIRSTDPNFRPLNTVTGPDGCLYIVDMYRGIIQEGNWVKEGSFLREKVKANGLENNIGKGRIWRLVHRDHKPGPQPRMLDESPSEWVAHLSHPNGWWRDTAQRLLIVRGDKSVGPALTKMAQSDSNHLARLHAMWTLEGLGLLTKDLVRQKMHDEHPMVRAGAVRAAETLLKAGDDPSLVADIQTLRTDKDPTVALQVMMTGKLLNWPDWKQRAQAQILVSSSQGVREIGAQLLVEPPRLTGSFTKDERRSLERGQEIFRSLCFACHGFDGRGMPMAGREGVTMAPPLAGSRTVAQGDALLRVLLQGLSGPVEGKIYEAQMVTMGMNTDEWLADIASYVRKSFGNSGPMVGKDQVKKLRAATKSRTAPWTIEELRAAYPNPLPGRAGWTLTSNLNQKDVGKCVDGDPSTRWSTNAKQAPGQWFQIELPNETEVAGLELDTTKSGNDYPRSYDIAISTNGTTWSKPIMKGEGAHGLRDLIFPKPVRTRFIRITQGGSSPGNFWSIHELQVLRPPLKP